MTDLKETDEEILKRLEDISNENNSDKFNELYKKLYETENFKQVKELAERKPKNNKLYGSFKKFINDRGEVEAEIDSDEDYDIDHENHGFEGEDEELERIMRLSAEEYENEINRRIEENDG